MGAHRARTRAIGCDRLIGRAGDGRFGHVFQSDREGAGFCVAIAVVGGECHSFNVVVAA